MGDTYVVTGAVMTCTCGMAPSSLVVLPVRTKKLNQLPRGNIMDYTPMVNILPFGMCNTLSNPTVASATAAAQGVLTPMPCVPAIVAPWMPGNPQCMVQGQPALTKSSMCTCMWGGAIRFTTDGQMPSIPPIVTPPVSTPPSKLSLNTPLSQKEVDDMPEEEQEAYAKDMEAAQNAGASDMMTAESLDEMSKSYSEKGELDKSQKCQKASREYKQKAAQKQADAMQSVTDKYRGKEAATVQESIPKQELQSLTNDNAAKEQTQKEEEIKALHEKIAANSKELNERETVLKEKNQKVAEKAAPYEDTKSEFQNATKEKEKAYEDLDFWKNEEKLSRAEGASQKIQARNREQRKAAEAQAQAAVEAEKKASEKLKEAESEFNAASAEQRQAAEEWRECMSSFSVLSDKMQQLSDESSTLFTLGEELPSQAEVDEAKKEASYDSYNKDAHSNNLNELYY